MKRRPRQFLRDSRSEAALFRRRALLGLLVAVVGIAVLGVRYWYLQVESFAELRTRSEANRVKLQPIVPARGLIYDRNGRLLADNMPAYRLELVSEQIEDLAATLQRLSALLPISEEELERFHELRRSKRAFQAVPLKLRLSETQVATFAVNRYRFPGVDVVPYLTRRYPYGELFSHVVGYVGRIDAADVQALDAIQYAGTTQVGKSGIERHYETQLHGAVGHQQVETNAEGRMLRVLERSPAQPGTNLYLTIDADLQAAAVAAFEGQPGAAVAVDPRTGEVLAMVSLPQFDPNVFVTGISHADYAELIGSPGRPLFNRALSGGYEPGSTLKPFVGLAGLELGVRRPETTVLSTGAYRLPNSSREYRDWRAGGHGRVDLREALAQSVNTYFYGLAVELGIGRLSGYLAGLGFGAPTGIDLEGEAGGVLPTPEWKRGMRNEPWYTGETVIAGIGQGYWVTTPLQLVQAMSILAADGMRHPLHLVRVTEPGLGGERQRFVPAAPPQRVVANAAHVAAVREGLVAVMHGPTGTARASAADSPYRIAGKTGTAQRVSRTGTAALDVNDLPFHLRNTALFVAFAPAEDPQIALAVIVEHGGSGSRAAAPIARRILDAWILREPRGELVAEGAQ
ncbi:MAG TPA: penicillin-binding protein 2 [Xanthomonadaceae bacterium]|nr:penicillin-binding protein 2 [Xanthomonadaceae bacterium]